MALNNTNIAGNRVNVPQKGVEYDVSKRIMNGSTILFYVLTEHEPLNPANPRTINATKEMVIYLIGKGLVTNMRVTRDGDKVKIGGKGVNLNTLPVLNVRTQSYKINEDGKSVEGIKIEGQYELECALRLNGRVAAYSILDKDLKRKRISLQKLCELTAKGLMAGMALGDNGMPYGITFDINKLKVIDVDENGNPLNQNLAGSANNRNVNAGGTRQNNQPMQQKQAESSTNTVRQAQQQRKEEKPKIVHVRCMRMKGNGLLEGPPTQADIARGKSVSEYPFMSGDYLICGNHGAIKVLGAGMAKDYIDLEFRAYVGKTAICDIDMSNLTDYKVKRYGEAGKALNKNNIMTTWPVTEFRLASNA